MHPNPLPQLLLLNRGDKMKTCNTCEMGPRKTPCSCERRGKNNKFLCWIVKKNKVKQRIFVINRELFYRIIDSMYSKDVETRMFAINMLPKRVSKNPIIFLNMPLIGKIPFVMFGSNNSKRLFIRMLKNREEISIEEAYTLMDVVWKTPKGI